VPRLIRSQIAKILTGACALAASLALAANAPAPPPAPAPSAPPAPAPGASAAAGSGAAPLAPMSAAEVIQMLDETVDWYRTLGAQQQIADEPGDLLILSENRQIANQVVALAFDVARASADQLVEGPASSASGNQANDSAQTPAAQTLAARQQKLDAQVLAVQNEIDATRARLAGAPKKAQQALQSKIAELQGELDLLNAKKSILGSIASAVNGSDVKDVSSLRSQIDAMAVALPGTTIGASAGTATAAAQAAQHPAAPAASNPAPAAPSRFGVWDEAATVFKLSEKISSIDAIDRHTDALQTALVQTQNKLVAELRALSTRGDALMAQADSADSAGLGVTRDQLGALTNQFKQASLLFVPLKKQAALLDQYRRNLKNWRDAVKAESHGALGSLGIRVGVLGLVLGAVFALAELWHRGVLKYVQDSRRRYQLLLLRRIALWTLVVIIIGFTFASELGSIVTFAGLITAGLAVAMQSVLVSIVGYFFLIGKYGLRVGDRVQIGEVSGEIIELGMVRMYLMELAGRGSDVPTGRVAAFPNSVVFQVTTGLFKQIPGVSFAWHDITLALPPGMDYAIVKEKLFTAANEALADYREEIQRQTREMQKTTLSSAGGDALPTVQLSYSVKGVEAHVRYPVHLSHAAEIDERMSRTLLQVLSGLAPEGTGAPVPSA
jgi:small-conductance mechanosensitive channel